MRMYPLLLMSMHVALGAATQKECRTYAAERLPVLLADIRDAATQRQWYVDAEQQRDADLREVAQLVVIWDLHFATLRDTAWGTDLRRVGATKSPGTALLEQRFP